LSCFYRNSVELCHSSAGRSCGKIWGVAFVIVLPDTDLEGCQKIAKIMNKKVESLQIEHANSSVSSYVTISLGVAVLSPGKMDNRADLIGLADKALYRAKEEGRNRVC